jgi:hypothetical protein
LKSFNESDRQAGRPSLNSNLNHPLGYTLVEDWLRMKCRKKRSYFNAKLKKSKKILEKK